MPNKVRNSPSGEAVIVPTQDQVNDLQTQVDALAAQLALLQAQAIALEAQLNILSPRIYPDLWNDLQGPAAVAGGSSALTFEDYRDVPLKMYFFRSNQNDAIHLSYQMSHAWNGEPVKPHVHTIPMAASGGDVVFDGYYVFGKVGQVVPPLSGWTAFSITKTIAASDQYKEVIFPLFTATPPVGFNVDSALLWIYLRRPGLANPADTYDGNKSSGTASANLAFAFADVHFKVKSFGSVNEFPSP